MRDRLALRRRALRLRRDALACARSLLSSDLDASLTTRSSLLATEAAYASLLASLGSRRASLVSTLSSLFPIEPVASSPPESLLFSICSVPLPNSVYPGAAGRLDAIGVSTALGWTASAVKSLAGYLGITLLYPLSVAGSRSIVEDRVSSFLRGPRVFPLYAKGVDRHRFEYGVFLLNKDIEQVSVGLLPGSMRSSDAECERGRRMHRSCTAETCSPSTSATRSRT